MPVTLLGHAFASLLPDGSNGLQVQPQRDWNDEHAFTGGTHGSVLVRNTGTTKPGASWVASVATGSVFVSAGAGALPVWSAAPAIGTSLTVPLIIGGVLNTSTLTLKSTTANGNPGSDILFLVGNNGATEAMRVLETGLVSFNAAAVAANLVPALKSGSSTLQIRVSDDSAYAGVNCGNLLSFGATGIQAAAAAQVYWATRSALASPSDGVVTLFNFANTSFTRLQFGGTTASFPALKVSGTSLLVRLADDSGYASLTVDALTTNTTLLVTTTATITTSTTTPILYGGAGTTSTLQIRPTSGVGAAGADIIFQNGTAGAIEVLRVLNSGLVSFGGTSATTPALKSGASTLSIRAADDSAYLGLNCANIISSGATGIAAAATAFFYWTGRSEISSPGDGLVLLQNAAGTAFTRLQFGGTTNFFPSLRRTLTGLDVRLADDSAYGPFAASTHTAADSGGFRWDTRSVITAPGDGNVMLQNFAASDFGLLVFGGVTASFPALKRSTTALQVRLGDDSAYGTIDAGAYKLGGTAFQQLQSAPGNPTGTADLAGKMMGLAVAFTPSSTRILIVISGNLANNTINDGGAAQITHGTGGAPANGGALTGTADGNIATLTGDLAANNLVPFTCQAIVTGLTAAVALWIDLRLKAITGGAAAVTGLSVSICDLP